MLIADQREVCGSGRGKSEMKKLLEKFDKIDVEFVTLNISDFCFLRRNLGEISWKVMWRELNSLKGPNLSYFYISSLHSSFLHNSNFKTYF